MYGQEYMLIPFPLSAVYRAPCLNHGKMATRRWECVFRANGLLSWFDAMLDGCGLMALLLRAW
jgi:hypothetical protein